MKKKTDEEKYLKIFGNKHASVQQLQILILLLKSPLHPIFSKPGFIKNILKNYYLSTDHPHHNLVLTLLAMIAVHEKNSEEFHFILLKIIYLGQFDSEFLYASLSCIANFVGQYDLCRSISEEVGQNEMPTYDQLDDIVDKNIQIFQDMIYADNLNEITCFYRKSSLTLQILNVLNDQAFQYMMSSQTRVSTQDILDLWRKIFLQVLCESLEKLPESIDEVAIALLSVIFDKKIGYSKISKKITVSNLINYMADYSEDSERSIFLLKTLELFVLKAEKLNKFEKQGITNLIFKLILTENKDPNLLNEAIRLAKIILKLCEYDPEYLAEMVAFFNQHLISSLFQEEAFNVHMTVLMKYLRTENLSLVLNRLIELSMYHKKLTVVANTLSVLCGDKSQIAVGSLVTTAKPQDLSHKLMNAECYLYYYHLCNSRSSSDEKAKFDDLISLLVNLLNKKSNQCEAVFSLILNLLPHYGTDQIYTDVQQFGHVKISNKRRLSSALLNCINDTSETIPVLKFMAQIGKDLVTYFDIDASDINAIVTSIINFLSMNAMNLEVVTVCIELLSNILAKKENIICLPGIKLLFVENLLVVLEKEINPSLLPVIYFLYQYQSTLDLNPSHLKRRQDLLIALTSQFVSLNIDHPLLFRFILLDKLQLLDLKVLYQVLPEDQKRRTTFYLEEVLPVLKVPSQSSRSPFKDLLDRVLK